MAGLERRDDAFEPAAKLERGERFLVGRGEEFHPAEIGEPGMLRADAGIIEAGRDRMRLLDLAVAVHQEIGAIAVQHAGPPAGDRRRVLFLQAMTGRLDAVDFDAAVVEERMEQAHGVRAAADAGDQRIRQPAFGLLHLRAGLVADDALEVAHHRRIGMRAGDRADAVERVRRRW